MGCRSKQFLCAGVLSASFLLLGLGVAFGQPPLFRRSQVIMGTLVEVQLPSSPQTRSFLPEASKAAFDAIRDIDVKMSIFRPESEISQINRLAGEGAFAVSPETYGLLKEAVKIGGKTEGRFDITVGPLVELWGFHKEEPQPVSPPASTIKEAKRLVDYQAIVFDDAHRSVALKKKGARIDLGGIAKGFAVDRAVQALKRHGIADAFVAIGGDIFCLGKPSSDRPWQVGIRHPLQKEAVAAYLALSNQAVSTSGTYEKFFEDGEKKRNHLIDPRTGYPVQNSLLSVTVVAPQSWLADALATAFMVSGREKAERLIQRLEGVEAIFIEEIGQKIKISYTKGLEGKLIVTHFK